LALEKEGERIGVCHKGKKPHMFVGFPEVYDQSHGVHMALKQPGSQTAAFCLKTKHWA
jgi:hypothetical protein